MDDDEIRQLIALRLGDRLTDADIDALLPYVRGVLETSSRLAEVDVGAWDPRTISLAREDE